ncbi:arginine--tRNA ligase [Flagellimonas meridianipacifica]|uniref:Arginine--tRNA ligase n=1 Tax=Flagellimonas meridianipacifica TaxID=1080225 RepID=A0A2T0M8C5_9FLAO|nr:arginine--tRNA ligase [Allomuricauda pacifica]PRX53740.1 arginyl-tRNA synthetase [Allomuricauda pacifica]
MDLQPLLVEKVKQAVAKLYGVEVPSVEFQPTRKDFEGDITVVIFPMLRYVKDNPVEIGTKIGEYLQEHVAEISKYNVVKGFLNLVVSDVYYLNFFNTIKDKAAYGFAMPNSKDAIMVEYSSPNTNKPLHLGHIRNNLLGYSVAEILKASGHKVYKTQIVNDRGIHICKSMLAWQRFGNGETPESSGLKSDHLVGKYYVAFDKAYKAEIEELVAEGKDKKEAEKTAPILLEAQTMLRKWEAGEEEVVKLWKLMNGWVYEGFDTTYNNLGVDFDKLYYESDTYLLGKDVVDEGLQKGVFFRKDDGSVWIDLSDEGLDEKIVLRADGTAVYMTQDIGTAIQRVTDFPDVNGMVYTVGNEQDYHFKVLFLILKKLGYSWAEQLYHLSYGMVDLPSGKMKSREGTVVDADDLIQNMEETAGEISKELGKLDGYSDEEKQKLYRTIGLGALKYYILKVDPKKRILFNPEESVDFQGNTGPFIQYTYARIQSILRKADFDVSTALDMTFELHEKEKELLKQIQLFPETLQLAAENYSPALIANYVYDLVKEFNSFYQQVTILGESDSVKKQFRVQLSKKVGEIIQSAFKLLGINVPERM